MTAFTQSLQDTSSTNHHRRRTDKPGIGESTIATIALKPPAQTDNLWMRAGNARNETSAPIEEQRLKIRLAHSDNCIGTASMLVQKMYDTRGYPANPVKRGAMRFTLMAFQDNEVVGTVTLALDSEDGLAADQLYKENVDQLRSEGRKIGELTKLAIDRHAKSKYIFGGMLHIAYIYARRIYNYTDVVLEVVPHHLNYYTKMLGCEPIGEEKLNPRVNFPVSLLRLKGEYVDQMITLYGGKGEKADTRTLYAYFFSKEDEDGIMQRLLRGE
jgi:hypothetical protein